MDLALFDFDGTITGPETFTPFVKFATPSSRLIAGRLLLTSTILRYKLGKISASTTRKRVIDVAFKGVTKADIELKGQEYASMYLPTVLRQNALERIDWHLDRGDRVIVVSASLGVYLKPWCKQMNIELICTELEIKDSLLTGKFRGEDCTGTEKAIRVADHVDLDKFPTVYAYGDTDDDLALLELADEKYYQWEKI